MHLGVKGEIEIWLSNDRLFIYGLAFLLGLRNRLC